MDCLVVSTEIGLK
uniref:Uncharacterized protein n=1 Tax=Arundo donax TaxID=35708 RepID=A0A0A8ZY83_ARUDO